MSRTGKIARLPVEIRAEINRRLEGNQSGGKILRWLNALPQTRAIVTEYYHGDAITPQNLSEWRKGGFLDYVEQQEQISNTKALAHFALNLSAAAGGHISDGAAAVAAGRIMTELEGAEDDELAQLTRALASLRKTDQNAVKLQHDALALAQRDRQIDLDELRFQRQTAELFVKYYEDRRARDIVEGKATRSVKMDKLVQLMFGERPATAPTRNPE